VEVHHAIVGTTCSSVNGMGPTAAEATNKTVLFHYNHVVTGLVSLKVLRMQGLLLEYLPDNYIRLFCNCNSLHAGLRMFGNVIKVSLCRLLCLDCPLSSVVCCHVVRSSFP
jgi:hypothetical protein